MLTLREFIKTTLQEIRDGVRDAGTVDEKYYPARFAIVNGHNLVSFDIAITAVSETTGKAEGKIGISVIGIGGETQGKMSREAVSRVKFEVMIG